MFIDVGTDKLPWLHTRCGHLQNLKVLGPAPQLRAFLVCMASLCLHGWNNSLTTSLKSMEFFSTGKLYSSLSNSVRLCSAAFSLLHCTCQELLLFMEPRNCHKDVLIQHAWWYFKDDHTELSLCNHCSDGTISLSYWEKFHNKYVSVWFYILQVFPFSHLPSMLPIYILVIEILNTLYVMASQAASSKQKAESQLHCFTQRCR